MYNDGKCLFWTRKYRKIIDDAILCHFNPIQSFYGWKNGSSCGHILNERNICIPYIWLSWYSSIFSALFPNRWCRSMRPMAMVMKDDSWFVWLVVNTSLDCVYFFLLFRSVSVAAACKVFRFSADVNTLETIDFRPRFDFFSFVTLWKGPTSCNASSNDKVDLGKPDVQCTTYVIQRFLCEKMH